MQHAETSEMRMFWGREQYLERRKRHLVHEIHQRGGTDEMALRKRAGMGRFFPQTPQFTLINFSGLIKHIFPT